MYENSLNSIRRYHKFKLGDLTVDGKKFQVPVRVQLNKTNLPNIEQGIVAAYKNLKRKTSANEAPFANLSTGALGKFYSVLNDGIQKFTQEFNGVFVRTLAPCNFAITNLPWALNLIPGGSMDAANLS